MSMKWVALSSLVARDVAPLKRLKQLDSRNLNCKDLAVAFTFDIPTTQGVITVEMQPGAGVVFVGANGAGKRRLAVEIEKSLGAGAHRISAHRALTLSHEVPKISEEAALRG